MTRNLLDAFKEARFEGVSYNIWNIMGGVMMRTLGCLATSLMSVSLVGASINAYPQNMVLNLHEAETNDGSFIAEFVAMPDNPPDAAENTIRILFKGRTFSGEWLLSQPDNVDTPEERFVVKVHEVHSSLKEVEDYRIIVNDETYDARVESHREDPSILQDRADTFQHLDDVRLLYSIAYGPDEIFMVQYAGQYYPEPITSVIGATKTENGYLLTDGPQGDFVYDLFILGPLRKAIVSEMVRHLGLQQE